MKIEFIADKIIVFLYHYKLDINNIDTLNDEIKKIFIKLIKKYKINLFGHLNVTIYNNQKYGNILEILKPCDSNIFNLNVIDLKIILLKNIPMYLELDNYVDNKFKNIIIKNNKYYINIDDIDNILEYIEYGKISYNNI